MHTPSPLDSPRTRRARRGTCPAYVVPQVRELPLRLEPVTPDSFGEPVRARPTTTPSRGALS